MTEDDRRILKYLAATVESLRDQMAEMQSRMATKEDLAVLEAWWAEDVGQLRDALAAQRSYMVSQFDAIREEMVTKDELKAVVAELRAELVTKAELREALGRALRGNGEPS